jgi:NDP-sugar pyrophosphorylase family protein
VSVGDECLIGRGVTLENVHLDDGVIIGDGAVIRSSVVGLMAHIHSSLDHPTYIDKISGIGDEAVIEPGSHLEGVLVYPRTTVEPNVHIVGPAVIQVSSTSIRSLDRRIQSQARLLRAAMKGAEALHVQNRIHKIRSASV